MLFNSWAFIAGFLPLALAAFFVLGRLRAGRVAIPVLVVASLAFYAWWDWHNLFVLAPSLLVNFFLGNWLTATHHNPNVERYRRPLLLLGLVFNLGLLGTFKYTDFAIQTVNTVGGLSSSWRDLPYQHIVLPLGISFFSFEQIAYIVDSYRGQSRRYGFGEYCYFVTFFPHLIAGPIIQHNELLDQLKDNIHRPNAKDFGLGVAIFIIGLFKKVVIADWCQRTVGPIYDVDGAPTLYLAWLGTVGYSLQLYFDFSGYSDMAIGLARMVNIQLPQNFNSPYKAHNPIEFWRRWHMTLSRFLRNYLYIPLGGNRGSEARRYLNLWMTMALGGLWHGAGWGFVLWGGLNGVYLVINNLFRKWRKAPKENDAEGPWWLVEIACLWTFFLIMMSRVFFRSPTFHHAVDVLRGLFGFAGAGSAAGLGTTALAFVALYVFCRHAPNTQQLFASLEPVFAAKKSIEHPSRLQLRLTPALGVVIAGMGVVALSKLTHLSEFLYFQF